jgi:hypothetical protein
VTAASQDTDLVDRPPAVAETCLGGGDQNVRKLPRADVEVAGAPGLRAPAVTLPPGADCILSTLQCAKLLNIHPSSLRRMKDDGPPRIWVTTGRVGYRLSKIYEWMDSRGCGAGDAS